MLSCRADLSGWLATARSDRRCTSPDCRHGSVTLRLRASLASGLTALGRCEAIAGQRASALSRIAEARAIRLQLAVDSTDFKMSQGAFAELDAMDAEVRAGQVPSGTLQGASAWLN